MESRKTADSTARIEAFSDGVFAIATTLLVLDIHVPDVHEQASLFRELLANWHSYLAFVIGFFTLLVCWINHHYMFELILKKNDKLLLVNGFKLLIVSFTPFATALISKYIGTPHQQVAVSIYAGNFFLMGLAMTSLWVYAYKSRLTVPESAQLLKAATRFWIFASVISASIFIISFISIPVSLVLFGCMFLVYIFPKDAIIRLAGKSKLPLKGSDTVAEPNPIVSGQ